MKELLIRVNMTINEEKEYRLLKIIIKLTSFFQIVWGKFESRNSVVGRIFKPLKRMMHCYLQ